MIKKGNDLKQYNSFNLYYMNLNKVYEISMMINNILVSSYEKETSNIISKKRHKKSVVDGKIDSEYLLGIKSILESGTSKEKTSSSKMIEKLDVKTTKSILLKKIKNKAKIVDNLETCSEGDLIILENVQLSILDKKNLRQMLLLKRDALKGIQVEGIEINNIISSLIKDYSYILSGNLKKDDIDQRFVIKIPFEIENEFENNYNVDDIVLGNVSIIGIYKNKNNIKDIANNTLNYFSNIETNTAEDFGQDKFVKSSKRNNFNNTDFNDIDQVHYIDVIGVVQEIKFNDFIREKKSLWNSITLFFRRNKNEK